MCIVCVVPLALSFFLEKDKKSEGGNFPLPPEIVNPTDGEVTNAHAIRHPECSDPDCTVVLPEKAAQPD